MVWTAANLGVQVRKDSAGTHMTTNKKSAQIVGLIQKTVAVMSLVARGVLDARWQTDPKTAWIYDAWVTRSSGTASAIMSRGTYVQYANR